VSDEEKSWRAKAEAIRGVLADWNPVGVPPELARDEYDVYVFRVHRLLLDGVTTEQLGSELRRIEAELLGAATTRSGQLRELAERMIAAYAMAD
jgi:hypothetical protein